VRAWLAGGMLAASLLESPLLLPAIYSHDFSSNKLRELLRVPVGLVDAARGADSERSFFEEFCVRLGFAGAGAATATGTIVVTAGAVIPVVASVGGACGGDSVAATLAVGWAVTIGGAACVLTGTGGGVADRVRSRSPTRISSAVATVANRMFEVFQPASRTGVAVTGGTK